MIVPEAPTPVQLVTRETAVAFVDGYYITSDGRYVSWWYTKTGMIVKWSLFLAFLVFLFAISIAYWHARSRIRKGLAPLAYHRWMVHRADLARTDPRYAYPQAAAYTNYNNPGYGMNPMQAPPPMYDPSAGRPPMYEPPQGATKMDPSQWRTEPTRRPGDGQQAGVQDSSDFAPPPGPPPPRV